MQTLKNTAVDIFNATLARMKPEKLIQRSVGLSGNLLTIQSKPLVLREDEKVWVIGAGKAAAKMAAGLEFVLGNRIKDGIVIAPGSSDAAVRAIQILPGSHPWPDDDSVASTLELMEFINRIPKGATVIVLLSGGASALMELPAEGLQLEDIRTTYDVLLKSGAAIHEMNTVRKQLSAVKGGKMLQKLSGKKVINLLISDVPGDDPRSIGSGPTVPDPEKIEDARKIIEKHEITEKLPKHVRAFLDEHKSGGSEKSYPGYENFLIGTARIFAETAAEIARKRGFEPLLAEEAYDGPVEEVAEHMFRSAKKYGKGKKALLFFGESTVEVTGSGKGGRNQHLALLMAQKISGLDGLLVLSAGTDGGDGPTDAAGAVCAPDTISRAESLGMDAKTYAEAFDAYHYFKSLGDLLFTGPTGNNVMDFQMILTDR